MTLISPNIPVLRKPEPAVARATHHVAETIGFVVKFLSPKELPATRLPSSSGWRSGWKDAPNRFNHRAPLAPSTVALIATIAILTSAIGASLVVERTREQASGTASMSPLITITASQLEPGTAAPSLNLGGQKFSVAAIATSTVIKPVRILSGGSGATTVKTINVAVRTSVQASIANNGQAAIDAGGQVAVIWAGVGTIVSAHNTVDARALKLRAGDLVHFSGAVSGVYKVVNAISVPKGSPVSIVKQLGTGMMMQTCFFGTGMMRVVGLTPAG